MNIKSLRVDNTNYWHSKHTPDETKMCRSTSLTLRVIINWKQEASIPATATGVTEARTQAAENESLQKFHFKN
jgi:hypothetical protein